MVSEPLQLWHAVVQSDLGNSVAAEHAHTSLIRCVHFEPRSATTSLPNGPSLA